ncbi:MAG: polysaccharide biosynthesis/export family protein [Limisphaerales bacterium]
MKLFFSRLFASALLLAGLFLAGCASTPSVDELMASGGRKASPTSPANSANSGATNATSIVTNNNVARFHVGETVNITFSEIPDPIPPHEEQIKEDGTITLPLIQSVQAAGKTAGELQTQIHDLYVPKFYVRLNVVVKPGDLIYYVRGEVKQPGRQLYVGETTVTKAITSASDFTDFASHKVSLIRANGQIIKVNVDKALEDPALDPKIYPGDQIVVRRRIF